MQKVVISRLNTVLVKYEEDGENDVQVL